jgi:hypothetical protein
MLAVLPRQRSDELGGQLFVNAYYRQLGHWPNEAIGHMVDLATRKCCWFPTIAECLDLLAQWVRSDEPAQRQRHAAALSRRERNARLVDTDPAPPITQADVERMPRHLVKIGLACGALERDGNGNVKPAA